jgi:hypothetical protein
MLSMGPVMHIVKLANARNPGERHLCEGSRC